MNKSIFESLKRRCEFIERLIESCTDYLSRTPEGRLDIKKRGNTKYYYMFRTTNGRREICYLGNKRDKKVCTYAQRSYIEKLLRAAKKEHKVIRRYLGNMPKKTFEDVYYSLTDDRKELIKPYILSDEDYAKAWEQKEYTPKSFREGIPVYMTMKGERVRSKSEQIIADRLYANGIPYRYECPLALDDLVIHPDFTILRMSDREEVYLEHCGRKEDPGYAQDAISRFNNYALNGIVPGDRLFTLYETNKHPLDTRVLDKMIEKDFR